MKKLLMFLLVLATLLCFAACGEEIGQYQTYTSGDFTYELVGEEATIINYTGSAAAVVIPATLDGYPVVKLGSALFRNNLLLSMVDASAATNLREVGSTAFAGCTSLMSVTLPASVEVIGNGAFMGCTFLNSLVAPASLETIGSNAFADCTSLTSFSMGNGVLSIGKGAFENCTALSNVTFSSELLSIGEYAFAGCKALLSSFSLGDKLETIGNGAFKGCTMLTQVTLPKGLTEMGDMVFEGCTMLTQITFNAVGYQDADATDNSLQGINDDPNAVLNVIIGEDVLRVPAFAFFNVPATSVTFAPNSKCAIIGNSAFKACRKLTTLDIPDSVTSIEENAFSSCSGLLSISLPFVGANRDVIQSGAKDALFGYVFGSARDTQCQSVTQYYVGKSGVSGSASVTNYIPKKLATVTIRSGAVGYNAFDGCSMITSLALGDEIVSVVAGSLNSTGWYKNQPENNVVYANSKVLYAYKSGTDAATAITTHDVPAGVVSISADAFKDCATLRNISLPASLTDIGADAFKGCAALIGITVAADNTAYKSVDGVLYDAAQTELMIYPASKEGTTFTVPASVTTICADAFASNTTLETLEIPATVEKIHNSAIYGCTALKALNVPDENENYTAVDGVLFNKSKSYLIVFPAASEIRNYTIPNDVTAINARAFESATLLNSVSIGAKIASIGKDAFKNCTNVVLYTALPSAPENWVSGWSGDAPVYYNAKGSYLVNVDDLLILITEKDGAYSAQVIKYVYEGDDTATNVVIPGTVNYIASSEAEPVAVNVTKIAKRAFSNTPAASFDFTQNPSIRDFGNGAFVNSAFWNAQADGIVYLNNMVIGYKGTMPENYIAVIAEGTTAICYKAFYDQKNLIGVVIPESLEYIADSVFGNSGAMKSVYTCKTEETHAQITWVDSGNNQYKNAKVYYYSESAPEAEGNFWGWDENGAPKQHEVTAQ